MKNLKTQLAVLLLSTLCLFTGAHGQVQPTFTTFDAPGAGTGPRQGTYPFAINSQAAITGYYCDAITCHGFVRDGDGTFTTFDVPNDVNGTYPLGINEGAQSPDITTMRTTWITASCGTATAH